MNWSTMVARIGYKQICLILRALWPSFCCRWVTQKSNSSTFRLYLCQNKDCCSFLEKWSENPEFGAQLQRVTGLQTIVTDVTSHFMLAWSSYSSNRSRSLRIPLPQKRSIWTFSMNRMLHRTISVSAWGEVPESNCSLCFATFFLWETGRKGSISCRRH